MVSFGSMLDIGSSLLPWSGRSGARGPARGLAGLTERPGEDEQRRGLFGQAQASSGFADQGQQQFSVLGGQLGTSAQDLRDIASGKVSVSAEQLRQALGQNMSAQRSMAASASPQNAQMAALMASRNAMSAGAGLAGQQALAGIQERQAAQQALAQLLLQQRQQELQAALGGRQTAVAGYGGATPGQSFMDQWAGPIMGGLSLATGGGGGGK